MKNILLSIQVMLLSAAAAQYCVYKLEGSIVDDPILGWSWSGHLDDVFSGIENPHICGYGSGNGQVNQDNDGNWVIGCQEGYRMTMTKTGGHVLVQHPAGIDEWDTGSKVDAHDCYGACGDKGGICLQCREYDFTSDYGCESALDFIIHS